MSRSNDGRARNLRRGAARSLLSALLVSPAWLVSPPLAIALTTFCGGWVPLTLVEAWAVRGACSPERLLRAIAAVWAVSLIAVVGVLCQTLYLQGLAAGLGPGPALSRIGPAGEELLSSALGAGTVLAVLLSSHLAIRVEEGLDEGYANRWISVWVLALQCFAIGLAVGLAQLWVSSQPAALLVGFGAVSIGVLVMVCMAVVPVWFLASAADDLESRFWPPPSQEGA